MRKFILFTFSIFSAIVLPAQNENTKWYFGKHAALDFMTNPPTVLNNSAMNTAEGCASIADASGNLLFYTDGVTVWNSQHAVMANGTGLLGSASSVQSAIIIRQPGSSDLYYIFTMKDGINMTGANYSVVDMSLATGLGSVTVLNAPLYNANCVEALHATKHANGTDYWVMIHQYNSNNFRAYLLTSAGVNTTAVVSSAGTSYTISPGGLKFSHSGQKIVSALYGSPTLVELYDFDSNTGVVSNPVTLGTNVIAASYGCEFSPDDTKLYTSSFGGGPSIVQWNLNAGSNMAIVSSSIVIYNNIGFSGGGMQLAPNGKIYVAAYNNSFLSVINNPNVAGAGCNFVYGSLSVSVAAVNANPVINSASLYGLPNMFVSNGCSLYYALQGNQVVCTSTAVVTASVVNLMGNQGNVNYTWSNGVTTYTTAQVNALPIGNWTVTAIDGANCVRKSLFTVSQSTIVPNIAVSSIVNCIGNTVTLNASGATSYTWNTGVQTSSIVISPTTTLQYSVSATDQYGCIANSTVVTVSPTVMPSTFTPAISVNNVGSCVSGFVTLNASGAISYTWSNGAQTSSIAVSPAATVQYSVSATNQNGCVGNNTVTVSPTMMQSTFTPVISVGNVSVCAGGSVTLNAFGATSYTWSNGAQTSSIAVSPTESTQYSVSATNQNGCVGNNTVTVSLFIVPSTFTPTILVSNYEVCIGSTVVLTAIGASSYTWDTGTQAQSIVISPTTISQYYVSATDQHGCTGSSTVTITPLSIPEISLNTSSSNYTTCAGDTLILNANGANSYVWSINGNVIANTQTLAVAPLHNTNYYVTGTAQGGCESLSVPVSVTVAAPPVLSISGSTIYCSAQIITLTASGAYNYYWQWGGTHAHASSSSIVLKQGVTTQYTLTGTNEIGCKSVEVVTVTIGCVGVGELKIENEKLRIYPNPTDGMLNISPLTPKGGTIKIFNMLGSVVLEQEISPPLERKGEAAINVSEIPKGFYFIKIDERIGKFVKE